MNDRDLSDLEKLLGKRNKPEKGQRRCQPKKDKVREKLFDEDELAFGEDYDINLNITQDSEEAVIDLELERLKALYTELAKRSLDPLAIYQPTVSQLAFHKSQHRERLLYGTNRAGKSLAAAIDQVWTWKGIHPYRKTKTNRNRKCICVALDNDSIGTILWAKIARPGAFKIVRCRETGLWIPYRPDKMRGIYADDEIKATPPLLPWDEILDISYINKSKQIPSYVRIDGCEVFFHSSLSNPPRGDDYDEVWFDEEIYGDQWYSEVAARGTVDRKGSFTWSATPQSATIQMEDFNSRCENPDYPKAKAFFLTMDDNEFLEKEEIEDFKNKVPLSERETRVEGKFAIKGIKVYPKYVKHLHAIRSFPIPEEWTKFAYIDPGYQVCAVLFMAVPPLPDYRRYFYQCLYLKHCTPEIFGDAMAKECKGNYYEDFIIDWHMARQRSAGGDGRNIGELYSEQLKERGIKSYLSGYQFNWGCDNVDVREAKLRNWLLPPSGSEEPTIRIFEAECEPLLYEIERAVYKKVSGTITNRRGSGVADHALDDAEYAAAHDPAFVPPRHKNRDTITMQRFKAKQQRIAEREGVGYIRLGPGKPKPGDW